MAELETVVSAVGLTKEFRDFWGRPKARAVNDIDFEIRPGEVVGLLGPNGSGKSTTVKMLLGLLYPTGGRLSVFGRSPRAVETKREIGYLPEDSYLYKYLTAEETLDFFGSLFNLSAADRKQRIDQLLDITQFSHDHIGIQFRPRILARSVRPGGILLFVCSRCRVCPDHIGLLQRCCLAYTGSSSHDPDPRCNSNRDQTAKGSHQCTHQHTFPELCLCFFFFQNYLSPVLFPVTG